MEVQTDSAAVIPAIDTASSTAAIRSLAKRGIRTVVVSEHDDPPGFHSKYCDEAVSVPDPNTDLAGYAQAFRTLACRPDVAAILPFREADVFALAREKDVFSEHVGTPFPSLSTLQRVQDRIKLRDSARTAGVAMPRTDTIDSWKRWDEPCIIKPRYTMHAPEYDGRFDETTPEQASTTYVPEDVQPDPRSVTAEMGHPPLVQEYVPTTDEYGFFALYDHGEAVATFQHRQLRGWKYVGGPSAYRESVSIPALERAGTALLDELDWHGVAMVEFLRDPHTDEFKLMEINPRFWSSLPFTVQAGVDFPALYWTQALTEDQTVPTPQPTLRTSGGTVRMPEYDVGIGGHLLWGEVLHLHSILAEEYPLVEKPSFLGTLRDVGVSLVREPRFDYLSRDDPRPFVHDLRNKVLSIVERP